MKVLWILNGCGLEGHGITGAPMRFHEISRRWQLMGIEQSVMTTSGGSAMLKTLGSTVPQKIIPASFWLKHEPFRAFRFWSYLVSAASWRFRNWSHAEVVISVSDYFCDVLPAVKLSRRWNAKWIAWTHHRELGPKRHPGNSVVAALTYAMQEWSYRQMAAFADSVWALASPGGEDSVVRLSELGMKSNRFYRMSNGVDYRGIVAVAKPSSQSYDAVLVGVRPDKGMSDIVPIWQRVQQLRPGSTLLLMGGMSGESILQDQIKRCGLDQVISFYRPESGFVTGQKYWEKLKSARALFAPSPKEGWGIVVGEAMAAGLAVVAYDLPAYRKIYPNAYAAVPCFDHEAFARTIVKVLDDPEMARGLRQRGKEVAARYDWDQIAAADADVILL